MREEKTYSVYKHTFPNGKAYIGITSQKPEKRYSNGAGYKKCPKMHAAILHYGWNNVEHELLFSNLTKQQAEEKEIEMIAFYNSIENGYNIDHGGNCTGTHSIETREKISKGNKGKKMPPIPEERRMAMAELFSGSGNPFYGKHHTEDAKLKQSRFMRGNQFNEGNHHTEEFKAWKSEQMKSKYSNGNNPRSKEVVRTGKDGNEQRYYSLRKAAEETGISASLLCGLIKKKKEYNGYVWRYAT